MVKLVKVNDLVCENVLCTGRAATIVAEIQVTTRHEDGHETAHLFDEIYCDTCGRETEIGDVVQTVRRAPWVQTYEVVDVYPYALGAA